MAQPVTCRQSTVLTRRGFEVETGDAALAAVDQRSPGFDAVIVDLSLGGGTSGEQVLLELSTCAPTCRPSAGPEPASAKCSKRKHRAASACHVRQFVQRDL